MKNPLKTEFILWGCLFVIGILYLVLNTRLQDDLPYWKFYALGVVIIWTIVYYSIVSAQLRRKERQEEASQRQSRQQRTGLFGLFRKKGKQPLPSDHSQIDNEPPTVSIGQERLGNQRRT